MTDTAVLGPSWLEPVPGDRDGVDHLGLRAPGAAMANELLPGITNTTKRARYYTVIAWLFTHAKSSGHLRVLEKCFVLATLEHDHGGRNHRSVIGERRLSRDRALPLTAKIVSALDAPFYGPSATRLGIARQGADRLERTPLASALARHAGLADSAIPKPEATHFTSRQVAAVQSLCPCTRPRPAEERLLREVLFRLDSPREPQLELMLDGPRRRSLAILLATASRPGTEAEILQRLLDGALGRKPSPGPAVLAADASGWGLLALRWHFRFAIETIWAAFGRLLHSGRARTPSAAASLALDAAVGVEQFVPKRRTVLAELAELRGDVPGVELVVREKMRATLDAQPELAALMAAVQLAGIARSVQAVSSRDVPHADFLTLGGIDSVSLAMFAQNIDEQMQLTEWMPYLFERYGVAQHFLTAALRNRPGNGYFFEPVDDGYVLRAGLSPLVPDGGRTKIPAAMSLLSDVGLVQVEGNTYRALPAGNEFVGHVARRSRAQG